MRFSATQLLFAGIVVPAFVGRLIVADGMLSTEHPQQENVSGLSMYPKARPIVDLTVDQLREAYPEDVADLQFAQNQDQLDELLRKVGESVGAFFRDFQNTTSTEQVRQEKLRPDGKMRARTNQQFNYLMLVRRNDESIRFEEARTDRNGKSLQRRRFRGQSFLTSGFAGFCLFAHPRSQPEFRFRYLGRQSFPCADVIAFAQNQDSQLLGSFTMELPFYHLNRPAVYSALMSFHGLIWVAPENHQIVRMRADLLGLLASKDADLTLQTRLSFGEVRFESIEQPFWLPSEVVVRIGWERETYVNRHVYSDYRVFSVETLEKRGPVLRPPLE